MSEKNFSNQEILDKIKSLEDEVAILKNSIINTESHKYLTLDDVPLEPGYL